MSRIEHLLTAENNSDGLFLLHSADIGDGLRLATLLESIRPHEIYHLAAQSHVPTSFDEPINTGHITGLGTVTILETIRRLRLDSRFYQASSSEMFGNFPPPQDEHSGFNPCSPYGSAKLYAHYITRNYRDAFGVFAVSGILFNHESPRRGESFVTRKISRGVARIKVGLDSCLFLGNLDAVRDWGYAPEYVEAMWRMLQCDRPQDYVIATGQGYSVREFAKFAFSSAGLDWREFVRFDEHDLRPSEVSRLIGNSGKAEREIGWKPKVLAPELAEIMVEADMRTARLRADRIS